jgi:hypothetical protein
LDELEAGSSSTMMPSEGCMGSRHLPPPSRQGPRRPRDRWQVDSIFKAVSITNASETQSWVEALAALNKANYSV